MSTINPALKRYAQFNAPRYNNNYNSPAGYSAGAMSQGIEAVGYKNVMNKTLVQMGLLLSSAAAMWVLLPDSILTKDGPLLMIGLIAMTTISGFVISLSRTVFVPLIIAYAVFEGAFVGLISKLFETYKGGIVPAAALATTVTVGVIVAGQRAGVLRISSKFARVVGYAALAYGVFGLVCFVLALAGHSILTLGSPFSILVSAVGTLLATFSFLSSLQIVERFAGSADDREAWRLGYTLVVSVVWLYLEILRLFANISAANNR